MGVLACDRQDCENIMCDYISHTYGYLCYSCMQELKAASGALTIQQFMNTPAMSGGRSYEWENYVESEFKSRYEGE